MKIHRQRDMRVYLGIHHGSTLQHLPQILSCAVTVFDRGSASAISFFTKNDSCAQIIFTWIMCHSISGFFSVHFKYNIKMELQYYLTTISVDTLHKVREPVYNNLQLSLTKHLILSILCLSFCKCKTCLTLVKLI